MPRRHPRADGLTYRTGLHDCARTLFGNSSLWFSQMRNLHLRGSTHPPISFSPARWTMVTPPLTTESPTTHTTDQHHVPIDPRAAELMPIHAAGAPSSNTICDSRSRRSDGNPRINTSLPTAMAACTTRRRAVPRVIRSARFSGQLATTRRSSGSRRRTQTRSSTPTSTIRTRATSLFRRWRVWTPGRPSR